MGITKCSPFKPKISAVSSWSKSGEWELKMWSRKYTLLYAFANTVAIIAFRTTLPQSVWSVTLVWNIHFHRALLWHRQTSPSTVTNDFLVNYSSPKTNILTAFCEKKIRVSLWPQKLPLVKTEIITVEWFIIIYCRAHRDSLNLYARYPTPA